MKKKLCLFMSIVMAALLLTACGGSGDSTPGSTAQGGQQNSTSGGYVFTSGGTQIVIDADAASIIEALGEPASYYEAASCAFDGLDKFYTYGSFEVDTYPDGDKDKISAVILKDDMVSTPEGIAIGASREDVVAKYGEGTEQSGALVYAKGGMELRFILQEGAVASIEYRTTVV